MSTSRHRALLLALVGTASLATAVLFVNAWQQREWLASKWLFRAPWGLSLLGASAAVCSIAFLVLLRREVAGMARPLRWIPPLAVAGWIGVWTVDPPVLSYDAQLAFSIAAAAWCAAVAACAGRPPGRVVRLLEIAALEIAIVLVLAEIGLRVARSSLDLPLLATSGTEVDAWLRTHRLPPGSIHLGFPVNQDGVVDVEPSEAARRGHRVVVLGDSFGVGVVPHHLHYTTVAERRFEDLEVYDLGVVNAGPREYARLLEVDGLDLRPELVVVALFLGNDVLDADRRRPSTLASWTDRDEILVLQLGKRLLRLAAEPSTADFGLSTREPLAPEEVERRLPWLADPLLEPPTLSAERFAYVEATRAEITLPEHQDRFVRFFEELERIREVAGSIPVACLLVPDEFQVEDDVWRDVAWSVGARADRELPQRIVRAWLDERGIPCVDLLPLLRDVPPLADGRRHVYHLRDTHWNARGNRIAGEALADLIERSISGARTRR